MTAEICHTKMNDVQGWAVACKANELKKSPLRVELEGKHVVLFRDTLGIVRAFLDEGFFSKFETFENAGLVFVNLHHLKTKPEALDFLSKGHYSTFVTHEVVKADEADILEHALDPFHSFANWKKKIANVHVRISKDLMEADYFSDGNSQGKTTARFIFPNIFQLSYNEMTITGFLTRRNATQIDVWRVIQHKRFLPTFLVKWATNWRFSQSHQILEKENYLGFPLRHRLNGYAIKEHAYQVKRYVTKDWTFSLKRSLEKV